MSYDRGFHYKEMQPGLGGKLEIRGWQSDYIGKGIWQICLEGNDGDRCITADGDPHERLLHVPINHRLVRFEWKITDPVGVDSAGPILVRFSRHDYEPSYVNIWWIMYYTAASTENTEIIPFGEGYEYLSCDYRIQIDDAIQGGGYFYPKLWIQEIRP